MDLIKKLTGKNPDEYGDVARELVDTPNITLFAKLIEQDNFLFDFVKNNVAKRIKNACNQNNYLNLLSFFDYYSPSYDSTFAEVISEYGDNNAIKKIVNFYKNGSNPQKAYAAKFLALQPNELLTDLLPQFRMNAKSDFEPLSINSIEVLAKINDTEFKNEALSMLNSDDEFTQYNGVKYLVTLKAIDALSQIISTMKKSSLSENIAAEIPYLIPIEELIESEDGILILCNIVNAIPEIIPPSAVLDYNLFGILENLYINNLTSTSAVLLKLAKDKFNELCSNEEYLFDCDKNTKEEVFAINNLLSGINTNKLKSLLYDELYDESDFVLFAVDFVDEPEELETLLDGKNQTLILKVLSILKEKNSLTAEHKETALRVVTNSQIKQAIEVL